MANGLSNEVANISLNEDSSLSDDFEGFRILHINTRSLVPKIEELRHIVTMFDIDCLSVNETWVDASINDCEINIPGFCLYRCDRNRSGGGVALYIKESYSSNIIDIKQLNCNLECVFCAVRCKHSTITIGSVYRPPDSGNSYHDSILMVLDYIYSLCNDIILMGDLNYNCYQNGYKPDKNIVEISNNYELKQVIDKPTRVTLTTSSLLDVLFIPQGMDLVHSDVLNVNLSDHYGIYAVVPVEKEKKESHTLRIRKYNKFSQENFIEDLKNSELLKECLNVNELDQAWGIFKEEFLRICERHAPFGYQRLKQRDNPWFDKDLQSLIYKRDYFHKKAVKFKNQEYWEKYRVLRNMVTSQIKKAKRQYYTANIKANKGKSKEMWSTLNHVLPSKKKSGTTNDVDVNEFCSFFSSVGTNLTENFGELNLPRMEVSNVAEKFSFELLNEVEVYNELRLLKKPKSCDILGFSTKLLRIAAPVVAVYITHIFNLSLCIGKFHEDWKLAKVTPIYKGEGSKQMPTNYRPISVVCTVAKILETLVKKQLIEYFTFNNLFCTSQYAYLKNHSTQNALHEIYDECLLNVNTGNMSAMCALDLSKGFDTLNHNILLSKLEKYGLDNECLMWFQSYLCNRRQVVRVGQKSSSEKLVNIGVPQGSCLGPILFLVYVNDFPTCVSQSKVVMYADDTTLISSGKGVNDLNCNIDKSLQDALNWYDQNRLVVNSTKSKAMCVGTSQKLRSVNKNIEAHIEDRVLDNYSHFKLLGVEFDSTLSFCKHVENVTLKVVSKIGLIHRLRQILDVDSLNIIYITMIQSVFDNCLTVWGSCASVYLNKIQSLQNRAARAVTGDFDFTHSVSFMIKSLGWMNIRQRHFYFICILMYKCLNDMAPERFKQMFTYVKDVTEINTRSASNLLLKVPKPNCEMFKRGLSYLGPTVWNSLPFDLRCATSLSVFKMQLKKYVKESKFV